MHQFIDGISEPAQFYFRNADGNFVPFTGIQEITIQEEVKYNPGSIIPTFDRAGELCFTTKITPKSLRDFRKMIRSIENYCMRRRRTFIRNKEKERRNRLKGINNETH